MKIGILLGRGIEGCGVTKFTLEQIDWFRFAGHDVKAFALNDKSWTRKSAHDVEFITTLKFKDAAAVDSMVRELNTCSMVIINSLPPCSLPENLLTSFDRALANIKVPIVLVQHDHSILSIQRNGCMNSTIKRSNVIFAHSPTNDFGTVVNKVMGVGSLSSFFDDAPAEVHIENFQPGMDFDRVRAKYWKDIDVQDSRHNKWIGRTTSWKGYKEMFEFHAKYLKPNGYMTTFEGIERSPAYLGFRELADFKGTVNGSNSIDGFDLSNAYGDDVYVFGPYTNHDMLERMSKVAFGYQLSMLKPRFINRSIEYTHCEVACTGVVPVFRKAYGEVCMHRKFGKPLAQCENTGTIWLGEKGDMEDAFKLIRRLSSDPSMRNEYREQAFEFYKLHQDAKYTFPEMLSRIMISLKVL